MIQEILFAHGAEFLDVRCPSGDDFGRGVAALQAFDRRLRAEEFDDLVELEIAGIEAVQGVGEFESMRIDWSVRGSEFEIVTPWQS